MDALELHQAKVELLDAILELAENPVGDPEAVKAQVEELFSKLENLVAD